MKNTVKRTLASWMFLFGILALPLAAKGQSSAASVSETRQIAPGIWRLRFGVPEKLTPNQFRAAAPKMDALNGRPSEELPFDLRQTVFTNSNVRCAVQLPLDSSERLYGFGLNGNLFIMTEGKGRSNAGRHVFMRPADHPENDLNDSHAPVPFYVSTRGYGVYVDTARYVSFYTGNMESANKAPAKQAAKTAATDTEELYFPDEPVRKAMLIDVPGAPGVDVYIFAGPSMAQAVQRYILFSGGGALPPLWGLGVAYRGYSGFNARETLAQAKSLRDEKIPCDVWGLEPGWQTHAYSCSFVWNSKNFPSPDDFVKRMGDMGYHLNAWQHCFTSPNSPIHDEIKPFSGDYRVWKGLVPDFALPQARKIFQGLQEESLFSKGIDGVKLDECDHQPGSPHPWSFPEASQFPSGLDGEQMHVLIGTLYQQTMLEPLRQKNVRTWSLARSSGALAAPLPFVLYSDSYKERSYVRALVKQGFCGLLWAPEVRDADSLEELCRRVQAGLFAPQLLINAWYIKNPPWFQINRAKNVAGRPMNERGQAAGIIKSLFELRMSFVPYLYAAYNEYYRNGVPPVRALVIDWPEDSVAQRIDDQFMVGQALLVAPIFTGQKSRKVYLPKGEWFDYWTGTKIQGGRVLANVKKPLDQIPIYVKAGAILPLAKPVERIAPDTCFEIMVRVYGDGSAGADLYDDDGVSYNFKKGEQNKISLNWNEKRIKIRAEGDYRGPKRYAIMGTQVIDGPVQAAGGDEAGGRQMLYYQNFAVKERTDFNKAGTDWKACKVADNKPDDSNPRINYAKGAPSVSLNVNAQFSPASDIEAGFVCGTNDVSDLYVTGGHSIDPSNYKSLLFGWFQTSLKPRYYTRLVVRVGGKWYASDETFKTPMLDAFNMLPAGEEIKTFAYVRNASKWRQLRVGESTEGVPGNGGGSIEVGSQPRADLNGSIEAFGLLFAGGNICFDNFSVEAESLPEKQ
jgi:alpha-D-xyloside xylohydrolase